MKSNTLSSSKSERSLVNEEIGRVISDVAEVAIDSELVTGVLKDIPFFGTITGVLKAGRDIRNELFLRKIVRFSNELSLTTPEERIDFSNQFNSEKETERLGETLMLILDRVDDVEKPKIIGRLMAAAVRNQVPLKKILRSCAIVNRCYMQDLEILKDFVEGPQFHDVRPIAESLLAVGVLTSGGFDGGNLGVEDSRSGTIYYLSEYGELLREYGLKQCLTT